MSTFGNSGPASSPFGAPSGPSIPQRAPRTRRAQWQSAARVGEGDEPAWLGEWRAGVDDKIDALTSSVAQLVAGMQRWMGEVPSRQEMQRADEQRVERSAYDVAMRGLEGQLRDIRSDLEELRTGINDLRKGQEAATRTTSQGFSALDARTIGWLVAAGIALVSILGPHLLWH
jgi:hypothetical protein